MSERRKEEELTEEMQERKSVDFQCACGSTSYYLRNMCCSCYKKWKKVREQKEAEREGKRKRRLMIAVQTREVAGFICDCGSKSYHARGMCQPCYERWKRQQKKV